MILGLCTNAQSSDSYNIESVNDSFRYSEAGFSTKFPFADTLSFGSSYFKNIFKISTDVDSVKFAYDIARRPYKQSYQINIHSPSKNQVVYVTFYETDCWFTDEYIRNSNHKVVYQIPEVYELANVLYALTNSSQSDSNRTLKNTLYYKDVLNYFSKFKSESIIKKLEFDDEAQGAEDYYNFRDNSICFKIEKGKIVPNNQYYAVWGGINDNLFAKYINLINDFYKESDFHNFFQSHRNYYDSLIREEQIYMPAKKMWNWLEDNFKNKISAFKITFSPLILGSHSTQIFTWYKSPRKTFSEADMFISGTRGINKDTRLNQFQKEGISSGIIFTEIDHNYCNPISLKYKKEIDSAFSNRYKWVEKGGDIELYPTPMAVFNEYITHAVYILYAHDQFKERDFEIVKKARVDLMVKHRKYIKFKEFTNKLLQLYENKKPNETVPDLFPKIIAWCNTQN